jgi:hypothetical protein
MMKPVGDFQGGLADSAATKQVCEQAVSEQEHELERIEGREGLEVAVGVPDSPAGYRVDLRMEIGAVAAALYGNDDAREGSRRPALLDGIVIGVANTSTASASSDAWATSSLNVASRDARDTRRLAVERDFTSGAISRSGRY